MFYYAILGIVQGLTEFLPVSSSGHLVLFSRIFNILESQVLPMVVVCHMGTVLSLLCFFAKDIWNMYRDLITVSQIFVVSLITGIIALLGKDFFEQLFGKPNFVCWALLVTALLLILTHRFTRARREMSALNMKDAFWLGISQGLAIIPGISRSGITIFSLLARGVKPGVAFKFSFIAGIPAILGAFLWKAKNIGFTFNGSPLNFWIAFLMSFLFGLIGLFILRRIVRKLKLHYFGYYLIVIAILGFTFIK